MKKFTYLLAVAAVFTACNSGNNGYTVTGTVEGAADGDTVYLETVEGRQFVKLDSAVIKDGTFTFKGTQDTAVNRYISYKAEGKDGAAIDFFLENGKIKINLSQENNSATGTANNDAYQEIRAQINGLNKQMMSIYESMSDTTLTDEQREAKGKEMENLENSMISAIKAGINKNITNPVGVLLLKQNYYYMDVADLDPLMPQIPAAYDNDEAIVTSHIKMLANAGAFASAYRVAEMLLPDGKPEYRRLKMFLRCLNCEWNDPEVMDTVSNSSYWNKIVVLAAQEDPGCWGTALYMLDDATQVDPADPRALYLKAQLRFNLDAPKRTTTGYMDDNFMFDEFFEPSADDPTVNSFGDKRMDWGLPMVQCCLKDERNLKHMLNDGTFNKDYRKAFKKYWKKLKANPEQCRKILADLEKSAAPQQAVQPAASGDAGAPATTPSAGPASGTESPTDSAATASPPVVPTPVPVQQPAATPMEE